MIVRLETREVTQRLADGVEYTFWTFGGTVPGSFMRAIGVVLNGLSGPIRVNGAAYNSVMPGLALSDDDVANVLTYVYRQWGNKGTLVTPAQVKAVRSAGGTKANADAH